MDKVIDKYKQQIEFMSLQLQEKQQENKLL